MIGYDLPTVINIEGIDYNIQSDFRVILDILIACADPDLNDYEKQDAMYQILYVDSDTIPVHCYEEACKNAADFIDGGLNDKRKPQKKVIDWQHDAVIIMPAVNKVAGKELRAEKYMHWWTGSSPLTRGIHRRTHKAIKKVWFIPAHAGNTRLSGKWAHRAEVHPRSRGEYFG